ncbi:unnamed protein product [Microthlaspi erraticum]|uniref:Uncharacterized protein n=1 Tax=Microthlaspi erraticum TaxID=1685480 RepID=A0A6D2I497_9BRAS|nr:unnamed protein product [Microthlaspi erraticum]
MPFSMFALSWGRWVEGEHGVWNHKPDLLGVNYAVNVSEQTDYKTEVNVNSYRSRGEMDLGNFQRPTYQYPLPNQPPQYAYYMLRYSTACSNHIVGADSTRVVVSSRRKSPNTLMETPSLLFSNKSSHSLPTCNQFAHSH